MLKKMNLEVPSGEEKFEWVQPSSAQTFKEKYMLNGEETAEEVFNEVAEEIASAEKTKKEREFYSDAFFAEMFYGRFIPGGRILSNARKNSKLKNYNNCFVIGIDDSIDSITTSLKEYITILKSGGGVGFNISKLRPKNSPISTGGFSSGPISFLGIFNEASKKIKVGGGRRGASIAILNVDHPDIEEFITYKRGDENKELTEFNISVGITDEFMKAVFNDEEWKLQFNGVVYKTLKARDLYNLICYNAYNFNEPGIFNLSNVNKMNNGYYLGEIEAVNPCQPEWAVVLTKQGITKLKDVKIGDEIWSSEGWTKIINKQNTGVKEVFAYKTRYCSFIGTSNHKVLSSGKKIEVDLATSIDLLKGNDENILKYNIQDIVDGLIFEDGWGQKSFYLYIKEQDIFNEIKDLIIKELETGKCVYEVKTTIKESEMPLTCKSAVPERFVYDRKKMIGFLRGMYSAKGEVVSDRINLESFSLTIIEQIQTMLNSIGIRSYYVIDKTRDVKSKGLEKYLCGKSYILTISSDLEIFKKHIGFIQKHKNDKLDEIIYKIKKEEVSCEIIEKRYISNENVYSITVDNSSHTYWTNGCNVSNCGELPLENYAACDLGSLNLTKFVENMFEENAYFDFEKFKRSVWLAVRFLDNVIDRTEYPISKIKRKVLSDRKIGLGFTGFGSALAMLCVKYGSQESLEFSHKLGEILRNCSYEASADIAKEKGSFPNCKKKKIVNSEFIKTLPAYLQKKIKKYGLRNLTLNSIAPTGTISFSVGNNCSSGIEPIFSLEYDRTIRTPHSNETRTERVFDYSWILYPKKEEGKPEFFITATEISPMDHILVQSVIQKYIDSSISKTINLPYEYSFEEYKDLFEMAYNYGLKGITTYRLGTMKGILDTGEVRRPTEIKDVFAPKRPEELPCDIYEISINKEKHIVLVGMLKNRPYEIFVTNDPEGKISKIGYKKGITKKITNEKDSSKTFYSLIVSNGDEKIIFDNIAKTFDTNYGTLSRFISLLLRTGAPIQFIITQLQKDNNFLGFERSVSRVLKNYLNDDEKVLTSEICACGSKNLVYKEGCVTCMDCGTSKCS